MLIDEYALCITPYKYKRMTLRLYLCYLLLPLRSKKKTISLILSLAIYGVSHVYPFSHSKVACLCEDYKMTNSVQ